MRIRRAAPDDAPILARQYVQAYTPPGGGDASAHYPFVQFLDPQRLALELARPGHLWLVAEIQGNVAGGVGAARAIAGHGGVSEFFGLVVGDRFRGHGAASRMVAAACEELAPTTHLLLAETRAAHPGGWRVFRGCGFLPIGFEPFAHRTPAGAEPMLFLARFGHVQGTEPAGTRLTVEAHRLAQAVLPGLARRVPPSQRTTLRAWARVSVVPCDDPRTSRGSPEDPARSGIVALDRIEGVAPASGRYETVVLRGLRGARTVGLVRVAVDHVDDRARVLELHAVHADLELPILLAACDHVRRCSAIRTLVVDVRADRPTLLEGLGAAGFFPTIYYPGLVAPSGRGPDAPTADAVQYTQLFGRPIDATLSCVGDLDWPDARALMRLIEHAARGRAEPQGSPTETRAPHRPESRAG